MHSLEKRDNLHIQDFDIVGNDLNVQNSTIKIFFSLFLVGNSSYVQTVSTWFVWCISLGNTLLQVPSTVMMHGCTPSTFEIQLFLCLNFPEEIFH